MNKYRFWVLSILLFSLTSSIQEKPKILIIGDSISIGYTPFIKKYFDGKAVVFHNPGNAQHTGTGIENIEKWLGNEEWDIIQFNWGLWDLCYRHPASKVQGNRDKVNGKVTFTVEEYSTNLDTLVTLIKSKSHAKLIFVTTSFVPKNEAGRFMKDAQNYNKAAKRIMKKHNVTINDIYKHSRAIHQRNGKRKNDVHFSVEGYEKLGAIISTFLDKEMSEE